MLEFPVIVNGKVLTAIIGEEKRHAEIISFGISFSDGYEDFFYWDPDNEEVFGTRPESKKYAEALRDDLPQALDLDKERFYNIFQHEVNGGVANVWVTESEYESAVIYTVTYKGAFRFALTRKNGKWDFAEVPLALSDADRKLFERTGFMLDSLL